MKLLNIQLWLARSRRILIWLIGLLIIIVYVIPLVLSLIGYKVDASGGILGRKAAQENNVDMCNHIIVYRSIFGPPSAQRRADCVRVYAERRKDPSACELLMPSSYGLSCVGGAQTARDSCSMRNGRVTWNGGEATYTECRYDDPKRSLQGNQCCLIARVTFVKSENNCRTLVDFQDLHDECLQSLAFKNHTPEICEGIATENTKVACTVNANAIKADPNICKGCKLRVENIQDLK